MGNILSDSLVINIKSNNPINNISKNIKKLKICTNHFYDPKISIENSNVEFLVIDHSKSIDTNNIEINKLLNKLPNSLKILHLDENYMFPMHTFPPNIIELKINADIFVLSKKYIPNTLQKLQLYGIPPFIIDFPSDLEVLIFSYNKIKIEITEVDLTDKFYIDLTKKQIDKIHKLLDNLPEKLKTLKIPKYWNYPLDNLPHRLTKLILNEDFNIPLNFLPESLKYLEFSPESVYSQPLDNLPRGLEYLNLQFSNEYKYPIENFPDSIKYLKIGDHQLNIKKLPKSLKKLLICGPVSFDEVDFDDFNKTNKKYYKIMYIGQFNVNNKIQIEIPNSLSEISWYNVKIKNICNYIKIPNTEVWIEDN